MPLSKTDPSRSFEAAFLKNRYFRTWVWKNIVAPIEDFRSNSIDPSRSCDWWDGSKHKSVRRLGERSERRKKPKTTNCEYTINIEVCIMRHFPAIVCLQSTLSKNLVSSL